MSVVYHLVDAKCGCMTIPICIDYGWPNRPCERCGQEFEMAPNSEIEEYVCD